MQSLGGTSSHKRERLLAGGALVVMLRAALALAADGEVVLCHRPPGDPNNYRSITVGSPAVAAHLAHGDLLGTCESNCPRPLCNGGNACASSGTWKAATERCECTYTTDGCDDGNPCTDDTCDATTGCTHTPAPGRACDDANACTVGDTCDTNGLCVGGAPLNCDDWNACTGDTCDPATGCVNTNNDANPCDDGNACTSDDRCSAGTCMGTPYSCEAPDQCQQGTGTCNGDGTCSYENVPDGTACDDGNTCTGCPAGGCQVTYDIDATLLDNEGYSCDPNGTHRYNGCFGSYGFHWNDLGGDVSQIAQINIQFQSGIVCDTRVIHAVTLNGTTLGSVTINGQCTCSLTGTVTQTLSTADAQAYNSGGMNSLSVTDVSACEGLSSDGPLGPGIFARVTVTYAGNPDQCVDGHCVSGPPAPNGLACDDTACTANSQCGAGVCVGAAVDCDDQNPCTDDSCDPTAGCVHTNNDGNTCNGTGTCANGQCVQAGVSACEEGTDPETGSPWVVCTADATTAWLSANSSGYYHAEQICQILGYSGVDRWGGTYGSVCGFGESETSCQSPGTEFFNAGSDPPNNCGSDEYGGILCTSVQWECVQ